MRGTYTEPHCAGSQAARRRSRAHVGPLAAALTAALAVGCAGDLPRGDEIIRSGAAELGVDATARDAGAPLGDSALAPDAGQPAEREVWVVVHEAPWSDGLRARLQPPHRPGGAIEDAGGVPGSANLLPWAGPGDRATPRLTAALAARGGRATGPIYRLDLRLDAAVVGADLEALVTADASWLAARLDPAPGALRIEDRPVIIVEARWSLPSHGAAFAAFRRALDARAGPAWWVALVVPGEPHPEGIDAVMPDCVATEQAARNRAQQAARRAGAAWLPCAAPSSNARLDEAGAVAGDPSTTAFRRALILARRAAGTGPVIVDGVGGWRDDRQLDPVVGEPTAAPIALTTGLVYAPYGAARLHAVREVLLRADGPAPEVLGGTPALLELVRTPGVLVERLDYDAQGISVRLQDSSGDGRYEVLLDDRPFRVPEGSILRYRRDDPRIRLDLVFADGTRLIDLAPDPGDAPAVSRPLDAFAGRRVEEVGLVYAGGAARLDARIERVVLASDSP